MILILLMIIIFLCWVN